MFFEEEGLWNEVRRHKQQAHGPQTKNQPFGGTKEIDQDR